MKAQDFSRFIIIMLACLQSGQLYAQRLVKTDSAEVYTTLASGNWKLVFSDEFNTTGAFDHRKWSYCPSANHAWAKFLTAGSNYASLNGKSLVLKMDNDSLPGDHLSYHSGGIQTAGKFNLRYGKIAVRARFKSGKGSWPAIWMMPEYRGAYGNWPKSGEIDIMEHVNDEKVIHQTIHNAKVTGADGGSSATHTAPFNDGEFNTYAIIWTPEAIQFYINGVQEYTYTKTVGANFEEWPFDRPFFLILNQSGGAGWPGPLVNADLPFTMEVDWVRIYKPAGL